MKRNIARVAWLGAIAVSLMALSVGVSRAQGFAPYREYEPVVVAGSYFQNWVGSVDETTISLHVIRNGQFVPIPFQVDKRRIIHTNYNVMVNDPSYQATNCELGYFTELHTGPNGEPKADFASNTLQSTDEFVFLLKDVLSEGGGSRASTTTWITDPTVGTDRYEIRILDPKTGAHRYVYAYLWPGQPPPAQVDTTDYVHWQADDPNAPCIGSAGACGAVSTENSSSLADVAALDTHFGGNWITDSLQIRNHGSDATPQPNLLDRFRYTAQGEDETSWSTGGSPEFLDVKDGRIRVVRGVEGAKSGRQTTKYEFVYPTMLVTRVNLRVHNLGTLTASVDHSNDFATDARDPSKAGYVWSGPLVDPPSVPANYVDEVNGLCLPGGNCDPLQFQFGDWVQVNSPVRGEYVQVANEPRPVPLQSSGMRTQSYTDSLSGSGLIADYTQKWSDTACTDDSIVGNTFSCDSPESDALYFARLDRIVVPLPQGGPPYVAQTIEAHKIADNILAHPIQFTSGEQSKDVSVPGPPAPCTPTLTTGQDPHTGAANLSVGPSGPCGGTIGVDLYRAEGNGAFVFFRQAAAYGSWTDFTTFAGQSYQYKAVAFNSDGDQSAYSNTLTITPIDTTPPPAPASLGGSAAGTSVTLGADYPCTHDLAGLNFYVSDVSGGPYTKLNPSPIFVSDRPANWTRAGFDQNHVYFFVATSVDFSGNESGYSPEVMVETGTN